jgi:hypothetical protein
MSSHEEEVNDIDLMQVLTRVHPEAAADEIKRLQYELDDREKRIHNQCKRIGGLEEESKIDFEERDRLLEQVEELEKEINENGPDCQEIYDRGFVDGSDGHHLSPEMVEKAVEYANKLRNGEYPVVCVWIALNIFGIFRCEGCDGIGEVDGPDPRETASVNDMTPHDIVWRKQCPKCKGKKYILKEKDDGMDND